MKLDLFTTETFPVLDPRKEAMLTINKNGSFILNATAATLIFAGKKQKQHISIAQDMDSPTAWYLVHEETNEGYKLSKNRTFRHHYLVKQIQKSLGLNEAFTYTINVGAGQKFAEGAMIYPLIVNTIKASNRK